MYFGARTSLDLAYRQRIGLARSGLSSTNMPHRSLVVTRSGYPRPVPLGLLFPRFGHGGESSLRNRAGIMHHYWCRRVCWQRRGPLLHNVKATIVAGLGWPTGKVQRIPSVLVGLIWMCF
jgi:hypothetical protein